ncbi:MAG: hypothetical protein WAV48_03350, partial [Candidatus Magasanikiibacteriota bacterium]
PYNGANDRVAPVGNSITLSGDGLNSSLGEEIVAGLCVYDRAGNMTCGRNREPYLFLGPWVKTSFGDIYSTQGGQLPFTQTIPTEDATINAHDNTRTVYSPFGTQSFTVGTGLFMTSGSAAQGIGINGGHISAGSNAQLGFGSNYRDGTSSKYNIFGFTPFSPGNEYERLRASAILNCELMNAATTESVPCQSSGSLATIGAKQFNILYLNNVGVVNNSILCTNTNVMFVTGALDIRGNVLKANTSTSGCIFVLANGASLTIGDTPSDIPRVSAGDGKTAPTIDKFEAAIVANAGASVIIPKGARGATTKSTDRLEIRGWVFSSNTLPQFKRDLAPVDNKRYPSEYIIYDAKLLDLFRPILGVEKTVDLTCGTSGHVLCGSTD